MVAVALGEVERDLLDHGRDAAAELFEFNIADSKRVRLDLFGL